MLALFLIAVYIISGLMRVYFIFQFYVNILKGNEFFVGEFGIIKLIKLLVLGIKIAIMNFLIYMDKKMRYFAWGYIFLVLLLGFSSLISYYFMEGNTLASVLPIIFIAVLVLGGIPYFAAYIRHSLRLMFALDAYLLKNVSFNNAPKISWKISENKVVSIFILYIIFSVIGMIVASGLPYIIGYIIGFVFASLILAFPPIIFLMAIVDAIFQTIAIFLSTYLSLYLLEEVCLASGIRKEELNNLDVKDV